MSDANVAHDTKYGKCEKKNSNNEWTLAPLMRIFFVCLSHDDDYKKQGADIYKENQSTSIEGDLNAK